VIYISSCIKLLSFWRNKVIYLKTTWTWKSLNVAWCGAHLTIKRSKDMKPVLRNSVGEWGWWVMLPRQQNGLNIEYCLYIHKQIWLVITCLILSKLFRHLYHHQNWPQTRTYFSLRYEIFRRVSIFFIYTTNLVWFEGQFWHRVVSTSSQSQLRGPDCGHPY
jgi:hypothetical protein